MRRFKFRFEAVLAQRRIVEERHLQELALTQREMTSCEARLWALELEYARTLAGRPDHVDLMDAERREQYLDTLRGRTESELRVREGISARLEESRRELVKAQQARKAVEKLREKDYLEYRREAARLEQAALDETAAIRAARDSAAF